MASGGSDHASEGRRSSKIAPRKCLTWLLKPIENDAFGSFFLLLLPRTVATFTSGPQIGKRHGKNHLPGETPCLWRTEKPQNCTPKMPNVTSETHRKWCFWLLFPLAAAMNFTYLYIRTGGGGCCCWCRQNSFEKSSSRQQNTMALKDEQGPKPREKTL